MNAEDPILKEELWSYIASYSSLQGRAMRLKDVCPCTHPPCAQHHCWVVKQWEKAEETARQGDTSSPFRGWVLPLPWLCPCTSKPLRGPDQRRKEPGAGVINLDKHTAKSGDFWQAWEQGRGEDTCVSAGGLSYCGAALAAAAKCPPLPQLRVPPKSAVCQG